MTIRNFVFLAKLDEKIARARTQSLGVQFAAADDESIARVVRRSEFSRIKLAIDQRWIHSESKHHFQLLFLSFTKKKKTEISLGVYGYVQAEPPPVLEGQQVRVVGIQVHDPITKSLWITTLYGLPAALS